MNVIKLIITNIQGLIYKGALHIILEILIHKKVSRYASAKRIQMITTVLNAGHMDSYVILNV